MISVATAPVTYYEEVSDEDREKGKNMRTCVACGSSVYLLCVLCICVTVHMHRQSVCNVCLP